MLLDFLVIIFFVLSLSILILMLATRAPSPNSQDQSQQLNQVEQSPDFEDLEELVEVIKQDDVLLKPEPPVDVPHIPLPGAKLGGGSGDEAYSKVAGTILLKLHEGIDEKRKYNRRLRDRRTLDTPRDEERRLIQRRVWLRREEDQRGKTLLTVKDAADTLGVSVERMYKWLDESDIPFYQVTEGKRKALRFEINELLQWYSAVVSEGRDLRQDR